MAQYTAKELKSITKAELIDILKKEGIEFDPSMPYFALRAKLINKDENKNDDSMARKSSRAVEPVIENDATEEVKEVVKEQTEVVEQPKEEKPEEVKEPEKLKSVSKPKPAGSGLKALRSELVKRKGGALGSSTFAAELARRKGERTTGVTFAQELKSRQLKYKGK